MDLGLLFVEVSRLHSDTLGRTPLDGWPARRSYKTIRCQILDDYKPPPVHCKSYEDVLRNEDKAPLIASTGLNHVSWSVLFSKYY
jgi:hypothetical protein